MSWYHHPDLVDRLAADYVAGTLHGGARRRMEQVAAHNPMVAAALAEWAERLMPMFAEVAPLAPQPGLWRRIAASLPASAGADAPTGSAAGGWLRRKPGAAGPGRLAPQPTGRTPGRSLLGAWLGGITAGAVALAVALVLGGLLPMPWRTPAQPGPATLLPESYVGVLATAGGKPGLIVSSLRRGRELEIKTLTPVEVPAGQTLFLWRIDAQGQVAAIGPLPKGKEKVYRVPLQAEAETLFFPAVALGVSAEAQGTSPGAPGGTFVYQGLCGKLWR